MMRGNELKEGGEKRELRKTGIKTEQKEESKLM